MCGATGNLYYLLDPTARLIEGKHALAATLLRRAMIEDTLDGAKSTRYKHAARHLLECRSLAASIRDFGEFETHEAFVSRSPRSPGSRSRSSAHAWRAGENAGFRG